MSIPLSSDDTVGRLALAHPALFAGGTPGYGHLPKGWYVLVDELCSRIEREFEQSLVARIRVLDIKEKFGTLRFYIQLDGSGDIHVDVVGKRKVQKLVFESEAQQKESEIETHARTRLRELVDEACEASSRTCDECGAPGSLRPLGWVRTLCETHFVARKRSRR